MSHKRKFNFEGFGINKREGYEFEAHQAPRRMYIPSPPRRGPPSGEDIEAELENIAYHEDEGHPGHADGPNKDGDEEEDPLDAFMAGIHQTVKEQENAPAAPKTKRDDIEEEEEDPMESFLTARKSAGLSIAADIMNAGYDSDEAVYATAKAIDKSEVEYDSDDNAIILEKKNIAPLPPLDHSEIDYPEFAKAFYEESLQITAMTEPEVSEYRRKINVRVSGYDCPRPIESFVQAGFDAALLSVIAKQGYDKPTPIQCQALPIVLSGRDIIGIAKTGSGKTAAFVLPMIVHIMDQAQLEKGDGPIGVVCAPTRELAQQIYTEAKKFAKAHGIRVSGIYGGMSKFEQFKELKAGVEVVIATPGRLIDMLKMKALTMTRATYLVLDEADRMFDMGFEPQVRSIVGQIRPDRQTLLFSATMPKRVERLSRDILSDPIRTSIGEVGAANEDIRQIAQVLQTDADKWPWLLRMLPGMVDAGDVLIFASTKARVDEVEAKLNEHRFKVASLHGDKDQSSRMEVVKKFKAGEYHVLVATDVAARGLDIKSIKTVVNLDVAKDIDIHTHRIGRTGRAGDKDGVAYTLVTQKQAFFAGQLVKNMITAGQDVPRELSDLAMKDQSFRSQREGRKGGGGGGGGWKGGRGKGGRGGGRGEGGGRSQRGVDYGLGLGYDANAPAPAPAPKPEPVPVPAAPAPAPGGNWARSEGGPSQTPRMRVDAPAPVQSRTTAVDHLKVGMMARFKSSFVAASSTGASASYQASGKAQQRPQDATPAPPVQGRVYGSSMNNSSAPPPERGTMSGFVSSGATAGFSPPLPRSAGRGSTPSSGAFHAQPFNSVPPPPPSSGPPIGATPIPPAGPSSEIANAVAIARARAAALTAAATNLPPPPSAPPGPPPDYGGQGPGTHHASDRKPSSTDRLYDFELDSGERDGGRREDQRWDGARSGGERGRGGDRERGNSGYGERERDRGGYGRDRSWRDSDSGGREREGERDRDHDYHYDERNRERERPRERKRSGWDT